MQALPTSAMATRTGARVGDLAPAVDVAQALRRAAIAGHAGARRRHTGNATVPRGAVVVGKRRARDRCSTQGKRQTRTRVLMRVSAPVALCAPARVRALHACPACVSRVRALRTAARVLQKRGRPRAVRLALALRQAVGSGRARADRDRAGGRDRERRVKGWVGVVDRRAVER